MILFDSHAHYDDRRFDAEFEGGGRSALLKAHELGVKYIANIGSSLRNSYNSVKLADEFDFVIAAVGIHPSDAQEVPAGEVDKTLYEIEKLTENKKVRAIGEIGYDYHWEPVDKEVQTYFFDAQLTMAERLGLPVIIHSRDAMGDTLDMIARHPAVKGVMHSFSGSAEVARQLCDKGWYVSFSGPLTYKNANKLKEAAMIVPSDRVLIETDSPYLPPVPHRGELNYSGYMHYTCEKLAEFRGITPDEAAEMTYRNACAFYGIDPGCR